MSISMWSGHASDRTKACAAVVLDDTAVPQDQYPVGDRDR
jgi:hypothetical protein